MYLFLSLNSSSCLVLIFLTYLQSAVTFSFTSICQSKQAKTFSVPLLDRMNEGWKADYQIDKNWSSIFSTLDGILENCVVHYPLSHLDKGASSRNISASDKLLSQNASSFLNSMPHIAHYVMLYQMQKPHLYKIKLPSWN